jgi:hypothetical protein
MRSSNGIGELLVGDVLDGVMQHYCRSAPMDAIAQIEVFIFKIECDRRVYVTYLAAGQSSNVIGSASCTCTTSTY